ncbi:MAG: YHS domain-containing protein, partial [Xanthobacteraceae bacterium]
MSDETKGHAACCSAHDHSGGAHIHHGSTGTASGQVIDPVCGMTVDPATAKHRADYQGQTYFFCSAACREKFIATPEKYLVHADK